MGEIFDGCDTLRGCEELQLCLLQILFEFFPKSIAPIAIPGVTIAKTPFACCEEMLMAPWVSALCEGAYPAGATPKWVFVFS